jgi:hypothetical protein
VQPTNALDPSAAIRMPAAPWPMLTRLSGKKLKSEEPNLKSQTNLKYKNPMTETGRF